MGDKSGAPKGNNNRLVHGGEAAIKRLGRGEVFRSESPAHQAQVAIYEELDQAGLRNYLESKAVQAEAICDLFYSEIARAAQARDAELLDRRVKRWGWMRGVADRTWKLVLQVEKQGAGGDVLDVALSASEEGDNEKD